MASAGSTIARLLTALALSWAVLSWLERMISNRPLVSGTVRFSRCWSCAFACAPTAPWSLACAAAT
jgi:hypothetical protein